MNTNASGIEAVSFCEVEENKSIADPKLWDDPEEDVKKNPIRLLGTG